MILVMVCVGTLVGIGEKLNSNAKAYDFELM